MSISIAGKSAIVTGAANGVGLATARHFADHGANVMFADADEKRLVQEVGEQAGKERSNVRIFAGDLRERLSVANLLSATIDAFDGVDILVNACHRVALSDPLDIDADAVVDLIDQNLAVSLRLTQQVARRMIRQAEADGRGEGTAGSIVNLSSIAAKRTHPELLAYSVSCAALDQMTRSLAVLLAPYRIRVNALALGSVMSASLHESLKANASLRGNIVKNTPLRRIASASEVAEAAQFLASEGSGFLTGQVIAVDGGRTLIDAVGAAAH